MEFALKIDAADQPLKTVPLTEDKILLGSLLSNHVVLNGDGVEPIHALIEATDDGDNKKWSITDLGSDRGVILNGKKIDVEAEIRPSDVAEIGSVKIALESVQKSAPLPPPPQERSSIFSKEKTKKQKKFPVSSLFNVREARPRGSVLEVVAYWDKTILEAEHFHRRFKDFDQVTIGLVDSAHFIAANSDPKVKIRKHVLAKFSGEGSYRLNLLDGMVARVHKNGKVFTAKGRKKISVGKRDVVHIRYGAVNYFLIFVKPPSVVLPPAANSDPLFTGLLLLAMLLYFIVVPALWYVGAKAENKRKDDIWAVVYKPVKKMKAIKKVKPPVPKKKVVQVKDKKPIKKPPPPKKKVLKPTKTVQKAKPKRKIVKPKKITAAKSLKKRVASPASPKRQTKPVKKPTASSGGKAGLRSSGVGKRTGGGGRKGKSSTSIKGVRGVKNKRASGPNLAKLGAGVGMVLSKRGPGAQYTDFKSSAGGAGGGRGSQLNTTGIGGIGKQNSLSLAGSKGALDQFGTGTGVLSGGGRGSGLGKGFGRGRGGGSGVNISMPSNPVVSAGLTAGEISSVIRRNLNQIRHCYERLLQRRPGVVGKAKTKFIINPNGRVGSARILSSNISDNQFRNCLTRTIKKWKFPKPRNNSSVDVNYPFAFNPL